MATGRSVTGYRDQKEDGRTTVACTARATLNWIPHFFMPAELIQQGQDCLGFPERLIGSTRNGTRRGCCELLDEAAGGGCEY